MSSHNRPWYKWWAKDFMADEKAQTLSPLAELLYRRTLDSMWQANALQLPSNCLRLANLLSKGLTQDEFKTAWKEIQEPGFEMFKLSECGNWIYSKKLTEQLKEIEDIAKKRAEAGRKGGTKKRR
jgi:hypothetical protein